MENITELVKWAEKNEKRDGEYLQKSKMVTVTEEV